MPVPVPHADHKKKNAPWLFCNTMRKSKMGNLFSEPEPEPIPVKRAKAKVPEKPKIMANYFTPNFSMDIVAPEELIPFNVLGPHARTTKLYMFNTVMLKHAENGICQTQVQQLVVAHGIQMYEIATLAEAIVGSACAQGLSTGKIILVPLVVVGNRGAHHTEIIVDMIHNTIEYFDPAGLCSQNNETKALVESFMPALVDQVNSYLEVPMVLKRFTGYAAAFQYLEGMDDKFRPGRFPPHPGFCYVWSLFWLDLRLSNPQIDPEILQAIMIIYTVRTNRDFASFIRLYAHYLQQRQLVINLKIGRATLTFFENNPQITLLNKYGADQYYYNYLRPHQEEKPVAQKRGRDSKAKSPVAKRPRLP